MTTPKYKCFCDKTFISQTIYEIHLALCLKEKAAIEKNKENSQLKRKQPNRQSILPSTQIKSKANNNSTTISIPETIEERLVRLEHQIEYLKNENEKIKLGLSYRIKKNIIETLNKTKQLGIDNVFSIFYKNIKLPDDIIESIKFESYQTILQNVFIYNSKQHTNIPIISLLQKKKTLYCYTTTDDLIQTPQWKIMTLDELSMMVQDIGKKIMIRFQDWSNTISYEKLNQEEQKIYDNIISKLNGCNLKDAKRNSAFHAWLYNYLEENIELICGWD